MAFIQVGIQAVRSPDGKFLPGTPIFQEVPDSELLPGGITVQEDAMLDDLAKIFAEKFKQYKDGCRKAEQEKRRGGAATMKKLNEFP